MLVELMVVILLKFEAVDNCQSSTEPWLPNKVSIASPPAQMLVFCATEVPPCAAATCTKLEEVAKPLQEGLVVLMIAR